MKLTQLSAVLRVMRPGRWYTARDVKHLINRLTGRRYETASTTARIRDLRKQRFGSVPVDCRPRRGVRGVWEYRVQGVGKSEIGVNR